MAQGHTDSVKEENRARQSGSRARVLTNWNINMASTLPKLYLQTLTIDTHPQGLPYTRHHSQETKMTKTQLLPQGESELSKERVKSSGGFERNVTCATQQCKEEELKIQPNNPAPSLGRT